MTYARPTAKLVKACALVFAVWLVGTNQVIAQRDSQRQQEPPRQPDSGRGAEIFQAKRAAAYKILDRDNSSKGYLKCIARLEEMLSEADTVFEHQTWPKGHPEIILTRRNLAEMYFHVGQYSDALRTQQAAYDMCVRLYPEDDWPNGAELTGECRMLLGRYHLANGHRAEFKRIMLEQERAFRTKHWEPTLALANAKAQLAVGLNRIGMSARATEYCLFAAGIVEQLEPSVPPEDRAPLAQIYWLCSSQLYDLFDVLEARRYAAEAYRLVEHEQFYFTSKVEALERLGVCEINLKNYDLAIDYLDRAYKLAKEFDERNAAGVARNLCRAHRLAGQLELAQQWLTRAKAYATSSGTNLPVYYHFEEGALQSLRGELAAAVESYQAALRFQSKSPQGIDKSPAIYTALGELEIRRGNLAQAITHIENARRIQMQFLQEMLPKISEASALSYLHFHWQDTTDQYLAASTQMTQPEQIRRQYQLVSQQRGLIVRTLALRHKIRHRLSRGDDLHDRYLDTANELARRVARGESTALGTRVHELQTQRDLMEHQLAESLPEVRQALEGLQVPVKKLQANLQDDELLLDFKRYEVPDGAKYAIFAVGRDSIQRIDLHGAQNLNQHVQAWRRNIAKSRGKQQARVLYDRIWKPLESLIPTTIKTLYICADDDLLLIPWNALQDEHGSILLERYAIATPPFPQHLLRRTSTTKRRGKLLTVGDVAYGVSRGGSDRLGESAIASQARCWPDLEHTRLEIAELKQRATRMDSVTELNGGQATVQNVLAALPGVSHAHLATHGFGLTTPCPVALEQASDAGDTGWRRHPLVTTGLVLAGANRLANAVPPSADSDEPRDTGKLDGATISNVDLSQAELVFLSACDTAVGDIFSGEGVFGLQRAFHIAGARNVVCALWQIEDAATALLVRKFYENLWDRKMSGLQALRHAQSELYRNPRLLEQFKVEHQGAFGQVRGVEFSPIDSEPGTPRLRTALWAGFTYSGMDTPQAGLP